MSDEKLKNCPVCGKPIEDEKLREYLRKRIENRQLSKKRREIQIQTLQGHGDTITIKDLIKIIEEIQQYTKLHPLPPKPKSYRWIED